MTPCFKKVIIWGHPLHSNTFSYVHAAFYKAFRHLGYDAYWMDNTPENAASMDFSGCLFLTETQVESHIPIRKDAYYILHNCDRQRYSVAGQNVLVMQTYTRDCIGRDERLAPCTYISHDGVCLFQPWATDLLPEEVDSEMVRVGSIKKERNVYWVGTLGDGLFGNLVEIEGFKRACEESGIGFQHRCNVSNEEHRDLIQRSYMAPQICGTWQVEHGYIPCRIFKNISYGQHGITNSKEVHDLFEGMLIWNEDTYRLFHDAEEKKGGQDLLGLMRMVRDNHTYVSRIKTLLNALSQR